MRMGNADMNGCRGCGEAALVGVWVLGEVPCGETLPRSRWPWTRARCAGLGARQHVTEFGTELDEFIQ